MEYVTDNGVWRLQKILINDTLDWHYDYLTLRI